MFPKEHERPSLHGCGVDEGLLSKPAKLPELEPFEVVGALLNVVLVSVMLEVEHLVTPEG